MNTVFIPLSCLLLALVGECGGEEEPWYVRRPTRHPIYHHVIEGQTVAWQPQTNEARWWNGQLFTIPTKAQPAWATTASVTNTVYPQTVLPTVHRATQNREATTRRRTTSVRTTSTTPTSTTSTQPIESPLRPLVIKQSIRPVEKSLCRMTQMSLAEHGHRRNGRFIGSLNCSSSFIECSSEGRTHNKDCPTNMAFDVAINNCNYRTSVRQCKTYSREEEEGEEKCGGHRPYRCAALPAKCIEEHRQCDGVDDCADGADEVNCPQCTGNEFTCPRSGRCISQSMHCNGVPDDCGDGSNHDEEGCNLCPAHLFSCQRAGVCIEWSQRCDGEENCPDGDDENNCQEKGVKYILCENQLQSVAKQKWCNGHKDCMDGSDEKYC